MRKRLDMQVKRGAFNVLLTTYDYVMREKSVLGKVSLLNNLLSVEFLNLCKFWILENLKLNF